MGADEQFGRYLPGAQQLELLRRLNQQQLPTPELAERVLAASAPGRGRPDLGLVGVLPESAFGPPPVDPADLPPDELVRVATALIAEDTVAAGDPLEPGTPRLLRRRYRVMGDPEQAVTLRDTLTRRRPTPGEPARDRGRGRHRPRGRCSCTCGPPARSVPESAPGASGSPARYAVRCWPSASTSPPSPRPGCRASGPGVCTSSSTTRAARHGWWAGGGVASRCPGRCRPTPWSSPVGRRRWSARWSPRIVAPPLMWHRLRPVLAAHPGPELRVPEGHRAWLDRRTRDLRRRLAAGDYAVHGALREPGARSGVTAPDEEGVLALAMRVLLGPAEQGRRGEVTKRVYLHVGTPKTGTSYLQHVLYHNRRTLHRHGINYPARRFDAHFLAALDLMRMPWGGLEAQAIGSWDKLATSVRRARGDSIISHEILATASRVQIGRALDSLGHGRDAEIHLVLSVRDLVRQVPAEWQENVKHRAALSYGAFLDQIRDPRREGRIPTWFWGVQEIPDILDRWGHDLPPEHVHVVTVPPAGGSPELLWKRFVEAFGLDGIDLQLDGERTNPSLGSAETTLIRRINRAANEELEPAFYRPLVRELLAHQTLSRRTRTPRLGLPPGRLPVGARARGVLDRGDPGPGVRRHRRPRRPARCAAGGGLRRPRPSRRGSGREGRGRRAQGGAPRPRAAAASARPAGGRALRDAAAPGEGPPAPDVPLAREAGAPARGRAHGAAAR